MSTGGIHRPQINVFDNMRFLNCGRMAFMYTQPLNYLENHTQMDSVGADRGKV